MHQSILTPAIVLLSMTPAATQPQVYVSKVENTSAGVVATVSNDTSKSVSVTLRFIEKPGSYQERTITVPPKSKAEARCNAFKKVSEVEIISVK